MNENLERGQPFFIDILKDGIALFEKPGHPFRKPKPLTPAAALAEAEAAFARFGQGGEFFEHVTTADGDVSLGVAAVSLQS